MLSRAQEQDLIAAAAKGDNKAIDLLCHNYLEVVLSKPATIVYQAVDAEEVVQLVMIKFMKYLREGKIDRKDNCRPLLMRITVTTSIDQLGKSRRLDLIEDWENNENFQEDKEQEETTEFYDEKIESFKKKFSELSAIDQAIVSAYYVKNYKYPILAEYLNISVDFAKKRVAYTRRVLKKS